MVDLGTGLREFYFDVYAPAKNQLASGRATVDAFSWEIARFDRYMRATAGRVATLGDLTNAPPRVVEVMRWTVGSGLAATTANKFRAHINAIWKFAHKHGPVPELPDNEKFRVDLPAPRALLPEEFRAVLAAAGRGLG